MKWQLTYKGKGYGRIYCSYEEVLKAHAEMSEYLENLSWGKVPHEQMARVRIS